MPAVDAERRAVLSAFAGNVRAHLAQRRNNAAHRPVAQRYIPIEPRDERAAGEQAGEQAQSGAGIAAVDRPGWGAQPAPASPFDQHLSPRLSDLYPEGLERAESATVVTASRAVENTALAISYGSKYHRPVAD